MRVQAPAIGPRDGRSPRGSGDENFRILVPRPGGLAERFAGRFGGANPALVFAAGLILGFVLVAALSIALGALVTDVLIKIHGVASADGSVVQSIVNERTPTLTTLSEVGSTVGSIVLVVLAALVAIYFAFRRQWVAAAFAAFLPLVESGTYRLTSIVDPRHRPDVNRLEDLPVNASYPSGHTAASIAVYVGLVLLLTPRIKNPVLRRLAWFAAVLIPVFVALSRIYRGMHHPLDTAGGVLVGIGAITVMTFASRSAAAAEVVRGFPDMEERAR